MRTWIAAAVRWAGWSALTVCAVTQARAAVDPAVLRLGSAVTAYQKKDFFTAVHLLSESGQPAKLRDYAAYYLANAELLTNNGQGAARDLGRYMENPVAGSPLAGRLSLLYAKVLLGQPVTTPASATKARQVLEANFALLPQPDGDYALAQAFEATAFPRQAAIDYQRVYYLYPASALADNANAAAEKLRSALGSEYPEPAEKDKLQRAKAWLDAKLYVKARREYESLADDLKGEGREMAQTGVGAALFLGGDAAGSAHYLEPLNPANPEAAAERLYYLTEAYRELDNDSAMLDAVHQLNERYPASRWRLKALVTAGNTFLLAQDPAQYVPLYQAAAAGFPGDSSAALAEWRVVWASWLEHNPRRVALLREDIERFPDDTHASDALFFLGRASEQASDFAGARAYYECLDADFPHYYYAGLARERLADAKLKAVKADPAVVAWLRQTAGQAHSDGIPDDIGEPLNAATRRRIERGRLLMAAGMTSQAVDELEFGARQQEEQPTLLAMELSRSMPSAYLSVRVMKKFSGNYLSLPFDKASRAFWEMLFPMPYEKTVTASASDRDLDPYAVAGLIRQESEFNPMARSASAYGLMQLTPSTGRALGRSAGIRVSRTSMLYEPDLNIKLGTRYLRGQLDHWDGDWIKTLAAYNAGPSRVRTWLTQYGYNDPAEFIENIPFTETRDYVQAVLRNGQVYRELYGKSRAALAPDQPDSSDVPAAKIPSEKVVSKSVAVRPRRIAVSRRKAAAKKATRKSAPAKSRVTSKVHKSGT